MPGAARSFFHRLVARQERRSSAGLVSLQGAERVNCAGCCSCRRGVAGRLGRPAEVGDGGPKGRRQGGSSSLKNGGQKVSYLKGKR